MVSEGRRLRPAKKPTTPKATAATSHSPSFRFRAVTLTSAAPQLRLRYHNDRGQRQDRLGVRESDAVQPVPDLQAGQVTRLDLLDDRVWLKPEAAFVAADGDRQRVAALPEDQAPDHLLRRGRRRRLDEGRARVVVRAGRRVASNEGAQRHGNKIGRASWRERG